MILWWIWVPLALVVTGVAIANGNTVYIPNCHLATAGHPVCTPTGNQGGSFLAGLLVATSAALLLAMAVGVGRHLAARRRWITWLAAAGLTVAAVLGSVTAGGPHSPASPGVRTAAVIGQPIISTTVTAPAAPTYSTVDTSGQGASQYRIPSTAVTRSGTLVVCYDARRNSSSDLPSDIDIVCRRSTDEGATWGPQILAAPHSGGNTDSTATGSGDASLLYDSRTGRLFLSYESAPPGTGLYGSDTSTSPSSTTTVHPMLRWSDDDGQTWSAPVDLISSVKTSSMTGIFASSGHGTVLADGTLVQPYASLIGGTWTAWLAYSSDDGATWQRGSTIGTGESENKVAQLAGGSLLDDGRPTSSGAYNRLLATAPSVTGTWSTPAAAAAMPDPQCNGDIVALSNGWLLASNPDSQTARTNGVVRLSKDGGKTWPYSWSPTEASGTGYAVFGYSSMVAYSDGSIGIAYEHTVSDSGRSLVFAHFTTAVFPS